MNCESFWRFAQPVSILSGFPDLTHLIELLESGKPTEEISKQTGLTVDQLQQLWAAYQASRQGD